MESACYIMNAIYAAEVSNDKEALCTLYATAVVHMRERLWTWLAPFPEVSSGVLLLVILLAPIFGHFSKIPKAKPHHNTMSSMKSM